MVELPEGKMKSREGTVVDADDLIAQMCQEAKATSEEGDRLEGLSEEEKAHLYHIIGLGALKYFILKVDPKKKMLFNPKESIDFNGNTGTFIQYTHARIRSLLRNAEAKGIAITDYSAVVPNDREIALVQRIADFPAVVNEAGRNYSPALIANYTYDLVKEYNQFYHDCRVLNETDDAARSLRLELSRLTADIVRRAMDLLGIKVPDRM